MTSYLARVGHYPTFDFYRHTDRRHIEGRRQELCVQSDMSRETERAGNSSDTS